MEVPRSRCLAYGCDRTIPHRWGTWRTIPHRWGTWPLCVEHAADARRDSALARLAEAAAFATPAAVQDDVRWARHLAARGALADAFRRWREAR